MCCWDCDTTDSTLREKEGMELDCDVAFWDSATTDMLPPSYLNADYDEVNTSV